MKILSGFLLLMLTLGLINFVPAQCNPVLTGSEQVTYFGMTDSSGNESSYLICDNASFYYYNNNPDTIYLENSAMLTVGWATNLVVYMKAGAFLKIDTTTMGMYHFAHIYHDTAFVTFSDTAGHAAIQAMTACPLQAYDYSNHPGGVKPCSPVSVDPVSVQEQSAMVWPNPFTSAIHVDVEGDFEFRLFDLAGKLICSGSEQGNPHLDFSHVQTGTYLLQISRGDEQRWEKIYKLD